MVFDSRTGRTRTLANETDTLVRFASELSPDCLLICEATGGHEAGLLAATVASGVPAHRADARKVKAFIRSFGTLGKTDAIDARALAQYGHERHAMLMRWQPTDVQREQLQALVLTRRDLAAAKQAWSNRMGAAGAAIVKPYLQAQLDYLASQIAAIDIAIEDLIRDHAALHEAAQIMRSVVGIGQRTAAALLALMPELGTLNRSQAAALAGLAPHPKQSGMMDAYRRTKGGRPEVKRALFMAAMVAAKYNKPLKAFYEKLIAAGKKKLVALIAVMRKLVIICNATIRDAQLAK